MVLNKIGARNGSKSSQLKTNKTKDKNSYGSKIQIKEGVGVLMKTSVGRIPGSTVSGKNFKEKRGC